MESSQGLLLVVAAFKQLLRKTLGSKYNLWKGQPLQTAVVRGQDPSNPNDAIKV